MYYNVQVISKITAENVHMVLSTKNIFCVLFRDNITENNVTVKIVTSSKNIKGASVAPSIVHLQHDCY